MFKESDFEIPLEKQLRMQLIIKEIDECNDVETLRKHLKQTAETLMKYQHLLGKAVEANLHNCMTNFIDTIKEISDENSDGL